MSYVYGELDEHGIEVLPPPEWSDILHADEDDYSPSTSSSSSESSSGNSVSYVIAIQEGLSEETKNRRVIGVIQGEDNISTKVHMAIVPYFLNNPPQEYPTDPYVRWFICPLNAMG